MDLKNIKEFYSSQPEWEREYEKFKRFKVDHRLKKILDETKGPYPAGHGEDHVDNVIEIIDLLFNSKCKEKFKIKDVFNLLVAACIHDVAMIYMIPTGASGELADDARSMHPYEKYITDIINKLNILDEYSDRKEYILKLASAHANDKVKTVEKKLTEYREHLPTGEEKKKWEILVRLICIADYLDIGEKRLRYSAGLLSWDNIQKQHYDKHKYLSSPKITSILIILGLTMDAEDIVKDKGRDLKERLEILTIVQKVYYELEKHLKNLNDALESEWVLKPLDEDYFGRIFPLSYGIQLHSTIFDKAFKNQDQADIEIDMLGHSLFSRFVENEENLNERFFRLFRREETKVRILLLDPDTELQQSCEVYESQIEEKSNRYILPLYDPNFELGSNDKGDILKSLDKITTDWQNMEEDSSIKVKLTKKILYASIMRYGGYMIVTPYTMGLSSQSISIVYSKVSPIFDAFLNDFELLWDKKDETRLFLNKVGTNVRENNPIKDIISDAYQNNNKSNFNYEYWLLKNCKDRIKFWFENEDIIIPPYELEIQPTNTCNLKCTHCIGRHLDYLDLKKRTLEISDIDSIETLLDWSVEKFKIERLRISGLNGDPLSDDALEFTKALIKRNSTVFKREIILFTNGLNIDKAIDDLLEIDTLHISIDAGTKEMFYELKNSNFFVKIIENIRQLQTKKMLVKATTKIGIGFVVTQRNHEEVEKIMEEANKEFGVDFIRFKRDIHLPNSIAWRTWFETKARIEDAIVKKSYPKIDNIYITDLPWQHWNGNTEDCISHKFCLTVGADKKIYTCDHLTSKDYTAIAALSDKNDLVVNITDNLRVKKYRTYPY